MPSKNDDEFIDGRELYAAILNKSDVSVFEEAELISSPAKMDYMHASFDNTIVFILDQVYVLANPLCGVDLSEKTNRIGYDWYATQFLVAHDNEY